MADGFETDRTEAYFNGRLTLPPRPRRISKKKTEMKQGEIKQDETAPNEKSACKGN